MNYSAGRELCRSYVAGKPERFRQLLTEQLDHSRDLPADLAGPLPCGVDRARVLLHGPPRVLGGEPLPGPPRGGPGVPLLAAVLRRPAGSRLRGEGRAFTPGETADALLGLRLRGHIVILSY